MGGTDRQPQIFEKLGGGGNGSALEAGGFHTGVAHIGHLFEGAGVVAGGGFAQRGGLKRKRTRMRGRNR